MSYYFNGTTHRLEAAPDMSGLTNTSFTLFAWLKVADATPAGVATPISIGNASFTADRYCSARLMVDGNVSAQAYQSTSASVSTTDGDADCVANTWMAVAGMFTVNASHQVTLLEAWSFNGTAEATRVSGSAISKQMSAFNILRIGESRSGTGEIIGYVAHAAIWNKLLSNAELTELASGGAGGLPKSPDQVGTGNLMAYWPLVSNAAAHATYGGSAYDLTVTDAVNYPDAGDNPVLDLGGSSSILAQVANHYRRMRL